MLRFCDPGAAEDFIASIENGCLAGGDGSLRLVKYHSHSAARFDVDGRRFRGPVPTRGRGDLGDPGRRCDRSASRVAQVESVDTVQFTRSRMRIGQAALDDARDAKIDRRNVVHAKAVLLPQQKHAVDAGCNPRRGRMGSK